MKIYKMNLDTVIDTLSRSAFPRGCAITLQRNVSKHPLMEAGKIFNYTLYLVKGKEGIVLLSDGIKRITTTEDYIPIWEECDKVFLETLLKWLLLGELNRYKDGI